MARLGPPAAPLSHNAPRNLYFGPAQNAGSLAPGTSDGTVCPGTSTAPNPTAGYMCVYVSQATNIQSASGELLAGSSGGNDAADNSGFYLTANSAAPGAMAVRYVWAYKAP